MSDYPYVIEGGQRRLLALHPRVSTPADWPSSEEVAPIIPRSEWVEGAGADWMVRIKDQDGLPYCHSYAGALAVEIACFLDDNSWDKPLSGTGLGSLVTDKVSRGASLDEVLRGIQRYGVPLEEDVPEYDYRRRNWRDGWPSRCVKMLEFYDCGYNDIFDKITSALQDKTGAFFGIFGCSRPWGPHALVAAKSIRKGGRWGWRIANSWGTNRADNGFDELAENEIGGLDQFGGWIGRVVEHPSEGTAPDIERAP